MDLRDARYRNEPEFALSRLPSKHGRQESESMNVVGAPSSCARVEGDRTATVTTRTAARDRAIRRTPERAARARCARPAPRLNDR